MARYHFISGLPRSGSTLLAAILRQNPRFRAGMTSPVGALVQGVLAQVSAGSEFGAMVDREMRRRLLKGLFDSYYTDAPADSVVFDTNRAWCARMGTVHDIFPEAKVIACVRNVAWVYRRLLETRSIADTFNICSGVSHSLREVLAMMAQIAGYSIEIRVNPAFVRDNEVQRLEGDPALLQSRVGALPQHALMDTLRWMYESL